MDLTVQPVLEEEDIENFAFSVLKEFGSKITLMPQSVIPVSVSDRLPPNSDCNENGECWVSTSPGHTWELRCVKYDNAYDYWLPVKTFPFPLLENFDGGNVRFTYRAKDGTLMPASVSKSEAGKLISGLLEFKRQAENLAPPSPQGELTRPI
jgi:hypothetical protein